MGCNCGGSQKVQERLAQQRAAGERTPETGPKAPGYYSGPKRPSPPPVPETQQS